MFDDLKELYQELIKDHSRRPRNRGAIEGALASAGKNPVCGDNVVVYVKADGQKIEDIRFEGSGCEICMASASIMTETVKGKERPVIEAVFNRFREFLMTGKADEDLGKLNAFSGVHKFPIRVKCAVLPWHAMIAAFDGTAEVSTENDEGQKLT